MATEFQVPGGRRAIRVGISVALLMIIGIIALSAFTSFSATPDAQHVLVVRNGGPFDNRSIRMIVPPGAGRTWIGLYSSKRQYPDSTIQRYYTITSDTSRGDRPGVDVVRVPTKDGVLVGLEGTFYLTTSFDGSSKGESLVRRFDDQFGTRTFPLVASSGEARAPWDGDDGWAAFLDAVLRPLIDNELRKAIGDHTCAELLSSCILAQDANADATAVIKAGTSNQGNIADVQDSINKGLQDEFDRVFGLPYFKKISFRLVRVELPTNIQTAVNNVQAQRVQVAAAAAKVQQAAKQNEANQLLSKTYAQSSAVAQIDAIKALPTGANVFFGVQPVVTTAGR